MAPCWEEICSWQLAKLHPWNLRDIWAHDFVLPGDVLDQIVDPEALSTGYVIAQSDMWSWAVLILSLLGLACKPLGEALVEAELDTLQLELFAKFRGTELADECFMRRLATHAVERPNSFEEILDTFALVNMSFHRSRCRIHTMLP